MNNLYERTGLLSRVKESARLVLFIFLALILSIIVMNLLIFPIALFSVNNKAAFTEIFKILFLCFILLSLIYITVKRIIFYKKNDFENQKIIKNIFLRPLSSIIFIFIVLLIIAVLIAAIYYILQNNYYLLYKIINL